MFDRRLTDLRNLSEQTSLKVNREEQKLVQARLYFQTSQQSIDQLRNWLDKVEEYFRSSISASISNFNQAKLLHDQHKVRRIRFHEFII